MCDSAQLELTVIKEHFGLLNGQAYRKVSKQVCNQASKQVNGHGCNQVFANFA